MMTKKPDLSVYLCVALCSCVVGARATPIAPVDGPPELQAASRIGIVSEAFTPAPDVAGANESMWGQELARYVSFIGAEPMWDSLRNGWDGSSRELTAFWNVQAQNWGAIWKSLPPSAAHDAMDNVDAQTPPEASMQAPSIMLSQYVSSTLVERQGKSRMPLLSGSSIALTAEEEETNGEDEPVAILAQMMADELLVSEEEDALEISPLDAVAALADATDAVHPWPFSADIEDDELANRFPGDLESLGSISIGLTSAGRLINAVQVPKGGDAWTVVQPEYAWGAAEVIHAITDAAAVVHEVHPEVQPLRINHISRKNGGHLRPHRSHQAGRDVDLGLYYKSGTDPRTIAVRREDAMDLAANWTMLRRLLARSHIELIIVDRRIQRALYNYALSIGEDKAWLDSLFKNGFQSVFRHARSHRDHFHVRFCAPRSQELGLRIQPLLVKVPTQNVLMHRVASGDTLGAIASRYGSSVTLIQKRNGLRGTLIRVGQQLWVPLYGACTTCPTPPPLQVPPLRRPPGEGDVAWNPPFLDAGRTAAAF